MLLAHSAFVSPNIIRQTKTVRGIFDAKKSVGVSLRKLL